MGPFVAEDGSRGEVSSPLHKNVNNHLLVGRGRNHGRPPRAVRVSGERGECVRRGDV